MGTILNHTYPKNSLGYIYQINGVIEQKYNEIKQDFGYDTNQEYIDHLSNPCYDFD